MDLATAVPTAAAAAHAVAYPNTCGTHGGNAATATHGTTHGKHNASSGRTSTSGTPVVPPSPGASLARTGSDAAGVASADSAGLYANTLTSNVAEAVASAVAQIEPWVTELRADVAAHLDGRAQAAAGQLRQLEEAGVDGTDDLVEEVAWRRFSLLRAKQQLGCD